MSSPSPEASTETTPETIPEPVAVAAEPPKPKPAPPAAAVAQPRPAVTCDFSEMRLKIGDPVTLEAPQQGAVRGTARLLGWQKNQSILVTPPMGAAGRVQLLEGERVRLLAFAGRHAFAFQAHVLRVQHNPYAYLHLSYPEKVEGVAVRNSPRCRTDLPVQIGVGGENTVDGTILDIGLAGALVEVSAPIDSGTPSVQLRCAFELHDTPVKLELAAKINSDKSDPEGTAERHYRYGVSFTDLPPNDRLLLGAYVWYQMFEHPQNIA